MGRILNGNSVAAAQTVLSTVLGNVSTNPGQYDTTTTSQSFSSLPGGEWRASSSYTEQNSARPRNSTAFQYIPVSSYFSLQDELSNYTYVQGYVYNNNSAKWIGRVFDANLTLVTTIEVGNLYSSMFAVRLHNSALYYFHSSGTNLMVTKIALPSGTATTYTHTLPYSIEYSYSRVFNWPVNGKFWIYTSYSSTPFYSGVYTFDLATDTFAQFSTTYYSAGYAVYNTYAMHVAPDGTGVSLSAYENSGQYGVLCFTAATSNFSAWTSSGHYYNNYSGAYGQFCHSNGYRCTVTTDCVIDTSTSLVYWDGSTFREVIGHLRGGDTSVQTYINYNASSVYRTFVSSGAVHMSMLPDAKNLFYVQADTYFGGSGTYRATRTGSSLSFTFVSSQYAQYAVSNKLPTLDYCYFNHSGASLSAVATPSAYYSFSSNISGRNNYSFTPSSMVWYASFVTSTGKFYALPCHSVSTTNSNVVTGALPVLIPTLTKTYNVTVIGGGGASSGNSGQASSFAGIAAAAGQNRQGTVAGTTVLTSGPTKGTGGTGYGTDLWGQGEDTATAGTYGGGSGYVSRGVATLTAGVPYLYQAGFGPLYGKQGAILLEQI